MSDPRTGTGRGRAAAFLVSAARADVRKDVAEALAPPFPEAALFFPADTGESVPELWRAIEERLQSRVRGVRMEGLMEK